MSRPKTIIQNGKKFKLQKFGLLGVCPSCGEQNIFANDAADLSDAVILHPTTCSDCGLMYEEVEEAVFWYHLVRDDNGDTVDIERPKRVIIEVSGGVACATYIPEGMDVEIIDHD